ncbi:CanA1 [Symbiodinium sp. CCMP2592]|nr:CanA1 [Symbiodinium sp. CCMP2592]
MTRWPRPWRGETFLFLLLSACGPSFAAAERPQKAEEWIRKRRSSAAALHLEDGTNASDSAKDGANGSESAKDEAFAYADTTGQIAKLKKETKEYEDQVKGPVVDTADMWLQENTRHEEFVKELSHGMDIEKQLVHKLRTEAKKNAEEKMKKAEAEADVASNSTEKNSTQESSAEANSTEASSSGGETGQSNATSSSK